MRESIHDKIVVHEYPLDEYGRGFKAPHHAINASAMTCAPEDGDASWYGGIRTQTEAEELFTQGWRPGAERLESMSRDINPPTSKSRKRKTRHADDGDELVIDRAIVGDWDTAWRTSRREWSAGPTTIDLYGVVGGNADRSAEELFWQGATCAVLVDVLEQAGYRVAIHACATSMQSRTGDRSHRDVTTVISVDVKLPDEPLQLDALAATVCHAGVFRTLGFRAIHKLPLQIDGGLGRQEPLAGPVERVLRGSGWIPEGGIVVGDAYTRDAAITEINRVLSILASRG